jgi:Ig-like domain CHU_C associated/CHU_C Type IX secretion signal domain/PKD-like domain
MICAIGIIFLGFANTSAQTVIFSNPGTTYQDTDGITTDTYNGIDISDCSSVVFSLDYSFTLPWSGPGNMESNTECPFAPTPCTGNPAMPLEGSCPFCWDFLYVQYIVDGVTVHTGLIGVAPNLSQVGSITSPPICVSPNSTASIIVQTQTWAAEEGVTFENITVTCWDASATPAANPDPACQGSTISLSGALTSPTAISSTNWTGPGTIATPANLNTTVTGAPVGNNVYTLTTTDDNACTNTTTVDVTVNPPSNVDDPMDVILCAGDPFNVNFTGTATNFTWTNTNTATGIGANGSGDISIPAVTNNTAANIVSTITVTPGLPCAGPPQTFTVTVRPRPTMTQPANITVCGGTTAAANFGGAGPGSTYAWTNNNPATGIADNGAGSVFSQVTDPVTALEVSTITVTPTSSLGCEGNPRTFTVTVNPPNTVMDPDNVTLCSGEQLTVDFMGTATNFNWTNNNTASGIPGSGSDDITGLTLTNVTASPIVSTITVSPAGTCVGPSQTFTVTVSNGPSMTVPSNITVCGGAPATNPFSGAPAGAVYEWTSSNPALVGPATGMGTSFTATTSAVASQQVVTITVTPSLNDCDGPPVTFTVTLTPGVTVVDPADVSICSGLPLNVNFAGTASSYSWVNNNTASGIPASGTGNISLSAINNTTSTPIVSTITVTPVGAGCPGANQTFTVTVPPLPTMNQPANTTVCAGTNVTAAFTGAAAGTTFAWVNNNPATGIAASGSGTNFFSTTNPITSVQVSTVTVTPSLAGCSGLPVSFTVTVQPIPSVSTIANQSVCAGQPVSIPFVTDPTALASWTNGNSTGVGGPSVGSTNPIAFTAASVTSTTTSVFAVNATQGACTGPTTFFTLTVNPNPTLTLPANTTFCPGQTISSAFGANVAWTNNNTGIGLPATGTGAYSVTAPNPPSVQIATVSATITDANNCIATGSYNITVETSPSLMLNSVNCASNNLSYDVAVTVSAGATITATAGTVSGAAPNFNVTNIPSGTNVTITATNTTNSCTSTLPVNAPNCNCAPVPAATGANNPSACDGQPITPLSVAAQAGLVADWYANPTGGVALSSGSLTYTPPGPIAPGTYTFYVEMRDPATNCVSSVRTAVTLTINAIPTVNDPADVSTCQAQTLNINLTGTSGATFNWANSNPGIGLPATGSGNISFSPMPGTATIKITPTLNGCPGTPQSVAINVEAFPTLVVGSTLCAVDLLTYSVSITSNNPSITSTAGTVSGASPNYSITGIPTGTNIVVSATSPNNCIQSVTVNAPNCTCTAVSPASNPNNPSACFGAPIPALSVTVAPGLVANWYAAASGGTALQAFSATYTPAGPFAPGTYVYYVETLDLATNCISSNRTPVTLTINPTPTVNDPADGVACAGQSIVIVVTGSIGATFNWTNSNTAVGLSATGSGNISASVPNNISAVQNAVITITPTLGGCTGSPVSVNLTGEPLPTLSGGIATCAANFQTYSIAITSNAPTITSTAGTVTGSAPNYNITGVPTGTSITVEAFTANLCQNTLNISSPNCACPVIPLATATNQTICDGITVPALSVTIGPGLEANWYAAPTGGIAIQSNSTTYTPAGPLSPGVYTFYVETRDPISDCKSLTRTPVTLTINAVPTANDPVDLVLCTGQAANMPITGTPNNATLGWTNSNPAIGLPASGTGNIAFTPTSAGTATITVTPTLNGCIGAPQTATITANTIPTLSAGTPACATNLQTYAVSVTSSATTITATAGTVSGVSPNFNVTGIPVGTNITVSASGGGTCNATVNVTSPTCTCPTIPAPGNPSNITICAGAPVPTLTVNVPSGLQANWYSTAVGGTPLLSNSTSFTPPVTPPAGVYTFYVETLDPANNCVSTRTPVVLTVNAQPTVNDPTDLSRCTGVTVGVSFSGTNGASFAWTNSNTAIGLGASGTGNINFNATSAGVANLTVTPSLNGCIGAPQNWTITIVTTPTASITGDLQICAGQSTVLTAAGGSAYNWSNGPNTANYTVNPIQTRTYTVTVTNGGVCTATSSATVVVSQPYNVTISLITCDPALVGSQTSPFISVDGCDSIVTTQTVIDLVACAPEATITGDSIDCFGDTNAAISVSVTDGFAPYTYTWASSTGATGNGSITTNNAQTTINNLGAGTYTITITSTNGASATFSAAVFGPSELFSSLIPSQTFNGFGVSCANASDGGIISAVTGGTPPYTYIWDSGQTSPNLVNISAGSYILTVTDANGCTDESGYQVLGPPPVEFDFNSLPLRCGDEFLAGTIEPLGQNGPYTVAVDNEQPSENLRVRIPGGQHIITVADANGCTAQEVVQVDLFDEVIVAFPPDTVITLGTELRLVAQTNLTAWASLQWSPVQDTARQNTLEQVWQPTESGLIRLELTDDNGCRGSATFRYTVEFGNIYVPNALYPADGDGNDIWRIFADESVELLESVHIFDRWGSAVYIWDEPVPLQNWEGWDGKVKSENANPAVFVFYAWVRLINGERLLLKGDINLFR